MSDEKILEPSFHFPIGVRDVRYKSPDDYEEWNDPDSSEEYDEEAYEFSGADLDDGEINDDDAPPYPPDSFTIVSQEVRTLKGGGQVVDVTIELPDLTDGRQYDLRLAKG